VISQKAYEKLQLVFSGNELEEAFRLLPHPFPGQSQEGYDAVTIAVVELSEGEYDRLRYFSERARDHPSDVVILAGYRGIRSFAEAPKGVLRGGRVTVPDVEPNPLLSSDDLWERCGTAQLQFCVVCEQPVSKRGSQNRSVMLGRHLSNRVFVKKLITVHRHCMEEGHRMAELQGYAWEKK
jgi:hypothetical protein